MIAHFLKHPTFTATDPELRRSGEFLFRHPFSIARCSEHWHLLPMALKDGKKGITAYIPPDLLRRVKIYGLMTDKTLTEITIDALTEYLNQKGVPEIQISEDLEK